MPHIDINDLHKERDKRTSVRSEIYNKVLARCHSKIKSIAKLSDICCCFFEVPAYIYGLPAYNQIECIYYVIKELIDDGFKVEFAEPNILFVTWYDKPKRKSLAEITNQTRLPVHYDAREKRTQNYNVNNSLYHDGLSELEIKSNQIFNNPNDNLNRNSRNSNNLRGIGNNSRKSKQPSFSRENRTFIDFDPTFNMNDTNNSSNNSNNNYNNISLNDLNLNNDDFKSFSINSNPTKKTSGRRGYSPTLSYENKPKIKREGFRSLFDDSARETSYKKMNNNINEMSLDDLDRELGFSPKKSNSPTPQQGNNFGFSPF